MRAFRHFLSGCIEAFLSGCILAIRNTKRYQWLHYRRVCSTSPWTATSRVWRISARHCGRWCWVTTARCSGTRPTTSKPPRPLQVLPDAYATLCLIFMFSILKSRLAQHSQTGHKRSQHSFGIFAARNCRLRFLGVNTADLIRGCSHSLSLHRRWDAWQKHKSRSPESMREIGVHTVRLEDLQLRTMSSWLL